jgi:catechol 2,3-dioxygenase-like lactoylglutathione lyase family enzyme
MESIPKLDGIHHVKLPVRDLARTQEWYETRLGYRLSMRFTKNGETTGIVMTHPNGGPMLSFLGDPERAARVAGFDYFSIGVPDKASLEALAERLASFGEKNAGVHFASAGWILPMTHDPDGHEVRFYTTEHHEDFGDDVIVIDDPVGTEAERERAHEAAAATT